MALLADELRVVQHARQHGSVVYVVGRTHARLSKDAALAQLPRRYLLELPFKARPCCATHARCALPVSCPGTRRWYRHRVSRLTSASHVGVTWNGHCVVHVCYNTEGRLTSTCPCASCFMAALGLPNNLNHASQTPRCSW